MRGPPATARSMVLGLLGVLWATSASAVPSQVRPIWPPVGAQPINAEVAFTWWAAGSVEGEASYDLQVDDARDFSSPEVDEDGLDTTTHSPGRRFDPAVAWYWRVRARDDDGDGPWSDRRRLQPAARTFDYVVEIDVSEGGFDDDLEHRSAPQVAARYDLAERHGLTEGVSYDWRVLARDEAGNARPSAPWAISLGHELPPPPPQLVYPPDGDTPIEPRPTLVWTEVFDPTGDVTYTLEIADESRFLDPLQVHGNLDVGRARAGVNLPTDQQLYWRVKATDPNNNVSVSESRSFQILGPALRYELQIAEGDGDFDRSVLTQKRILSTEYTLRDDQQLSEGQSYFWRVEATDLAGNSRRSVATFRIDLSDDFAPPNPVLFVPEDRSTVINPAPTFVWSAVPDPNGVTYRIEVDDDPSFQSPAIAVGDIEQPRYTAGEGALSLGARYHWRVLVRDSQGNSRTGGRSWFRVASKESVYTLQVAQNAQFEPLVMRETGLHALSHTLRQEQGLPDVGEFWWRVLAADPAGNERPSAVWQLSLEDRFPPPPPALLYPAHNEFVINPRVTLLWSRVVDPSGVEYGVQIATESRFLDPLVVVGALDDPHYTPDAGALELGSRYWWRVRTLDGQGNEGFSEARSFFVEGRGSAYELQVSRNDQFDPLFTRASGLEETEYRLVEGVNELEDVGEFWWRVVASDRAGNEQNSNDPFLITLDDNFPPRPPALIYPRDGERLINANTMFVWGAGIDPSGVTYGLEIDDSVQFLRPVYAIGNLEGRSAAAPAGTLQGGQKYWWRVRVTDDHGNTTTTDPQRFFVLRRAPTYKLEVSRRQDFEEIQLSPSGIEEATYMLAGGVEELEETGDWYWRITALDAAGNERRTDPFRLKLADRFPPVPVALLYPPHRAAVLNPRVTLTWSSTQDPSGVTYTVQADDDPGFGSVDVQLDAGQNTLSTPLAGSFEPGGTYWWRVIATDDRLNSSTSEPSRFTVDAHTPVYRLAVSRQADLSNPALLALQLAQTEYETQPHEELEETGRYHWSVQAVDAAGNERQARQTFVLQLEDRFPPPAPTNLYPQDGRVVINPRTLLTWTPVSDPSGVVYGVQLDDNEDFSSPVAGVVDLERTYWQVPRGRLDWGVTYHWRVSATDQLDHSVWSESTKFVIFDRRPRYALVVSTDRDEMRPSAVVTAGGILETEYSLAENQQLEGIGDHFWQVTARDPAGNEREAGAVFRMTLEDIYPPPAPLLIRPRNAAIVVNPATTFLWSAVTDPTGPVRYELQLDDDEDFSSVTTSVPQLRDNWHTLAGGQRLPADTTMWWRVVVTDGGGRAATSEARKVRRLGRTAEYALVLASSADMDDVVFRTRWLRELQYATPEGRALEEGGRFWWTVQARDLAGNLRDSEAWGFSLADIFAPPTPKPIWPRLGAAVANPEVPFGWRAVSDPSGVTYALQVDDDEDFGSPLVDLAALATPGVAVPALTAQASFWWRVAATDSQGNSVWSDGMPFTTRRLDPVYRLEVVPDDDFGLSECSECDNGAVEECGTWQGMCQPGLRECVLGLWTSCEGWVTGVPERCDGRDNDCDGLVDEGPDNEGSVCNAGCADGDLRPCGTGEGECVKGIQHCSGNNWQACTGSVGPDTERCDGVDNDCDGSTDEESVCDECAVDERALRIQPIEETQYTLGAAEQIAEEVDYRWRVTAIDKAGAERLSDDSYTLRTTEGGPITAGGLRATYYDGIRLEEELLWRIEPVVDQPASTDNNPFGDFDTGIGVDTFSVSWQGWVKADHEETYTFHATSDDGQRLWINGALAVDNWGIQLELTKSVEIPLTEGWHAIRYEYFENLGTARATLEYESASTPRQVIPATNLGLAGDPNDEQPPEIQDVYVLAVTPDSAIISYRSDEIVSASVEYGLTANYGLNGDGATGQRVRLTRLSKGRFHHFRLTLTDLAGNTASTDNIRFCTPGDGDTVSGRLWAAYHRGIALDDLAMERTEVSIDQPALSDGLANGDFGSGAGPDQFSVRWHGILRIPTAGTWDFHALSDDGQRLFLDEERVLNDWRAHLLTRRTIRRVLDASWHTLRYEYFDNDGPAFARVDWSGPRTPRERLPNFRLAYIRDEFFDPVLIEREEEVVVECTGPRGAPHELEPPLVYDCRDPHVTVSSDAPELFPVGESRVVWTAQNRWGRIGRDLEFVTVVDTVPPALDAPEDLVMEATSSLGSPLELNPPDADDICDARPQVEFQVCTTGGNRDCRACWNAEDLEAAGGRVLGGRNAGCECEDAPGRLDLGDHAITIVATDRSGNCSSEAFTVTVQDTQGPEILPTEPRFVCRAAPIPLVTVLDNSTPTRDIDLVCQIDTDPEPGDCDRVMELELGDHWVEYTATDALGNETVLRLNFEVTDADPDPPIILADSVPEGWSIAAAVLELRVSDNCDIEPDVAFEPEPDELVEDRPHFTATYDREGLFPVDVTAVDDAGSVSTLSNVAFGIDRTAPSVKLAGIEESDPEDLRTWPAFFAGESLAFTVGGRDRDADANSGLAQVVATLSHLRLDTRRVVHRTVFDLDDGEPPSGASRAKNLTCADDVPDGESPWCLDGELVISALQGGDWLLEAVATDVAGNSASLERHFTVVDWPTAIERTELLASTLLAGEDVPQLASLFLQVIVNEADDAITSAEDDDLIGNALLYTYSFITSLNFAESSGLDTGEARSWLARGAAAVMARQQVEVEDEVGVVDPDALAAAGYLDEAADLRASDAFASALIALLNTHFYQQHALDPYEIDDDVAAADASHRVHALVRAYLAHDNAPRKDEVRAVEFEQSRIVNRRLYEQVLNRAANGDAANIAFKTLLVRLNDIAALMADAQDVWVWTRNWLWPVSLQIRELSRIGIDSASFQMRAEGRDPDDSAAIRAAQRAYDDGVAFLDDRLVDEALAVYLGARCLIIEVYNAARFQPAATPPVEWECDDCVLDATCEH